MRVLLIEPSTYTHEGLKKNKSYRDSLRSASTLSLTLPLLAGLISPDGNGNGKHNVDVTLAYDVCEDSEEDYDLSPFDLVGITCTRHLGQMQRAEELAHKLKELGVQSIVGGPVTVEENHRLVPGLAQSFDAVAVGDAEPLVSSFLLDARLKSLEKVYRHDSYTRLEGLPVPRFDLVNFDLITPPHVFPAMTARGCPRDCDFCSEFLYSDWRLRPVDEVIAELEVYKYRSGAKLLVFRDDDFLVNPKRSRELLTKTIPLELEWTCQTDLNLARHMDLAELAVEAGIRSVAFGLESVLNTNRSAMGKNFFALDEARNLLRFLYEHGVELQINIIFGLDDDTPDIFDKTVDFLLENNVSTLYANALCPYPGTTLYQRLEKEGRLIETPMRISEDEVASNVSFIPKHMTPDQLVEGTKRVRDRFYSERKTADLPFWLGPEKTVY